MRDSDSGPYDLELIQEQCAEVGLKCELIEADILAINLTDDIEVTFVNNVVTHRIGKSTLYDDALIEFSGSNPSHTHTHQFEFVDGSGRYVTMHYLDVISGLATGEILVAGLWRNGELKNSWFVHKVLNNEFDHMEEDDEVRVQRVTQLIK